MKLRLGMQVRPRSDALNETECPPACSSAALQNATAILDIRAALRESVFMHVMYEAVPGKPHVMHGLQMKGARTAGGTQMKPYTRIHACALRSIARHGITYPVYVNSAN